VPVNSAGALIYLGQGPQFQLPHRPLAVFLCPAAIGALTCFAVNLGGNRLRRARDRRQPHRADADQLGGANAGAAPELE
jgi:hypothetical protein